MQIHYFDELKSTNDTAKQYVDDFASSWTFIIANKQTNGRGRLGKKWISLEGNLFCSIILRPDKNENSFPELTAVFGLVMQQVVESYLVDQKIIIKKPNDILVNNQKICGILSETYNQAAIIGIGLNILHCPETDQPTTCFKNHGINICKEEVIAKIYSIALKLYEKWLNNF